MEKIKVPFSKHVYDEVDRKIHFVKIVQNSPQTMQQHPDLSGFPFLMIVDYKKQIVSGLETPPISINDVRQLLEVCLLLSKQPRKKELEQNAG